MSGMSTKLWNVCHVGVHGRAAGVMLMLCALIRSIHLWRYGNWGSIWIETGSELTVMHNASRLSLVRKLD